MNISCSLPLQCLAGVHAMVMKLILGGAVCVIGGTVGNVRAIVENITSADDDMSELYKKTVDLWVPAVLEGTASVERWTRRHLTFLSKSAMRWTVCASQFPGDAGTAWGTSVRVCMGGGVHQGIRGRCRSGKCVTGGMDRSDLCWSPCFTNAFLGRRGVLVSQGSEGVLHPPSPLPHLLRRSSRGR